MKLAEAIQALKEGKGTTMKHKNHPIANFTLVNFLGIDGYHPGLACRFNGIQVPSTKIENPEAFFSSDMQASDDWYIENN